MSSAIPEVHKIVVLALLHPLPQLQVYIISNFLIVTFTTTTASEYVYSLYMRARALLVPCVSHPQHTIGHAIAVGTRCPSVRLAMTRQASAFVDFINIGTLLLRQFELEM